MLEALLVGIVATLVGTIIAILSVPAARRIFNRLQSLLTRIPPRIAASIFLVAGAAAISAAMIAYVVSRSDGEEPREIVSSGPTVTSTMPPSTPMESPTATAINVHDGPTLVPPRIQEIAGEPPPSQTDRSRSGSAILESAPSLPTVSSATATLPTMPTPTGEPSSFSTPTARPTSLPTAMPQPTSVPTPTSVPEPVVASVTITSPIDGASVAHTELVTGTHSNAPPDHQLWLIVQPHLAPRYHPQLAPLVQRQDGVWSGFAYFGEDPSTNAGEQFQLIVVLATRAASEEFQRYLDQSETVESFEGLPFLPEEGMEMVDQITVTRL